jgi:hypothetical protein
LLAPSLGKLRHPIALAMAIRTACAAEFSQGIGSLNSTMSPSPRKRSRVPSKR